MGQIDIFHTVYTPIRFLFFINFNHYQNKKNLNFLSNKNKMF